MDKKCTCGIIYGGPEPKCPLCQFSLFSRPKGRPELFTPEYIKWRKAVFVRDKYKCVVCSSNFKIQAHHIHNWASFPALRYIKHNGVTLCKKCHDQFHAVNGKKYNTIGQLIGFMRANGNNQLPRSVMDFFK